MCVLRACAKNIFFDTGSYKNNLLAFEKKLMVGQNQSSRVLCKF